MDSVKQLQKNKGIVILLAVLTVSFVLIVGMTLMNTVLKQLKLSSSAGDSALAIYAADAGIECVMMWDIRGFEASFYGGYVFATSTDTLPPLGLPDKVPADNSGFTCYGIDVTDPNIYTRTPSAGGMTTTLTFNFPTISGCSIVDVIKSDAGGGLINTSFISRGYNVSCGEIPTRINAVERILRVDFI